MYVYTKEVQFDCSKTVWEVSTFWGKASAFHITFTSQGYGKRKQQKRDSKRMATAKTGQSHGGVLGIGHRTVDDTSGASASP